MLSKNILTPMLSLALFTLIITSGQRSYAEDSLRSTEVVVCSTQPPQIYDVYEAAALRGLPFDLGAASLSVAAKLKRAIDVVAAHDTLRALIYTDWAASFFSEAEIGDFELAPANAVDRIAVPKGCRIHQLVRQKAPQFKGDQRYFIDEVLWKTLDSDQQATAVLHELVLREAGTIDKMNSADIRYFTSLIFSGTFKALTNDEYLALMVETRLAQKSVTYQDVNVAGYNNNYNSHLQHITEEKPTGLIELNPVPFLPDGQRYIQKKNIKVGGQNLQLDLNYSFGVYRNGALAFATIDPNVTPEWHAYGQTFRFIPKDSVAFFDDGNLAKISPALPVHFNIQGQEVIFAGAQPIKGIAFTNTPGFNWMKFARNGAPLLGININEVTLKNAKGRSFHVKPWSQIYLDSAGNLTDVRGSK